MFQNVETAGRKISDHGFVVGEISRTECPFHFHPEMDCEHSGRNTKFWRTVDALGRKHLHYTTSNLILS